MVAIPTLPPGVHHFVIDCSHLIHIIIMSVFSLSFCGLSDNKIGDEGARHIACSMHSMANLVILEYV